MIWTEIKNLRSQLILTAISGLAMTLAFPKVDMGWLAWFALAPFLVALRETTARTGFVLGFAFGMTHHLGLVYWTAHTMHTYGHLPMWQAVSVLFLFSIYLSLYPAGFAAMLSWLRPKPGGLIFLAPVLWVASELLKAWLFSGFPWTLAGYSQYDHPWVIQIADLFGVYGVSAVIVLVNTAVTMLLLHWAERPWLRIEITRPQVIRCMILVTAVMISVNLYGIFRMGTVDRAMDRAEKATVAVVQGNIDQAVKWDPRFQMLTTAKYRNLSLAAASENADLVIWPETATPFYFTNDPILSKMVVKGVTLAGTHFIIGSPSFSMEKDRRIFHNSAYMVTPEGNVAGRYDKVHLVPFGEYVPMKRWLPFIKKMVAQVGDFKPGRKGDTLPWEENKIGMLICYEVIFPGLARSMTQNGADLLVNITNDAWFGRTSAAFQHFSMAVLRAVENRRFLARAANTGISGFIDANGRIVENTALFTETSAAREVALLKTVTRYTQWGDWPVGLLSWGLLLPLLAVRADKQWPWIRRRTMGLINPAIFEKKP